MGCRKLTYRETLSPLKVVYNDLIINANSYMGGYRYGFNGMELDDNVKRTRNSYTTEFRRYDPRVGRWLTIDPLFRNFPWQSPYVAFDNNPIYYNDPRGLAAEGGGRKNRKKKETGQEKDDGTFDGHQEIEEVEILSPKRTIWQKLKTIFNKVSNSYKNDTKIVRDYRIVNYVLKKAVEYLNSLFPPGKYSPYEDRNKNPYETNGGLHGTSEDGQGAENHTVKYDPEKKNEPETINTDVVVPGADAVREAWNKLIQYNNKDKPMIEKVDENDVKSKLPRNYGEVGMPKAGRYDIKKVYFEHHKLDGDSTLIKVTTDGDTLRLENTRNDPHSNYSYWK